MKTPPLLLGAALVFWGWESGFPAAGLGLALALECAHVVKARWEFSDEDFSRVWVLCSVLFLASAVYAFTANEGPSLFGDLLQHPTFANQTGAGTASARTATALCRWLPMLFFLFVAAQVYSSRDVIPWTTISQISRWRWKKAAASNPAAAPAGGINVTYPYFALCLFAASAHPSEGGSYFCGLSVLLVWALWSQRPRRFGLAAWIGALALAILLGYAGERSVGRLQSYINPEWFSRSGRRATDPYLSHTSLGHIGFLKQSGRIVIRLKPLMGPPPVYLREASYPAVDDKGMWMSGVSRSRDKFESLYETNSTSWILLPGKRSPSRAQIACYLEGISMDTRAPMGLLPLPEGCSQLENLPPFTVLQKNSLGAILAEGPGLLIFDASFGPGSTIDSPADYDYDCQVPDVEIPALDQVISELKLSGKSPDEARLAIDGFFRNHFTYSLWRSAPAQASMKDETLVDRFLLKTRTGHCEYFATATTLLLRRLGIPARYAVGYAVHERSGDGYVVRQRDAHAWCLVWNRRTGMWENFDTTPPSWIAQEAGRASVWQRLSDAWSWALFEFSKFRWGQTHLRRYTLFLLAPVLGLLVYQIVVRRKGYKRHRAETPAPLPFPWPGLDSEFYLIERALAARNAPREPGETLSSWVRRITRDPAMSGASNLLHTLLQLHYRYRFDPHSLDPEERVLLRNGAREALEKTPRPGMLD